jgi:hypothetical protein
LSHAYKFLYLSCIQLRYNLRVENNFYNFEISREENTTEIQLLQIGYNFARVVPIVFDSYIRFLLGKRSVFIENISNSSQKDYKMSALFFKDIPWRIPICHLGVSLIPNTKIPKMYQNYGFKRFLCIFETPLYHKINRTTKIGQYLGSSLAITLWGKKYPFMLGMGHMDMWYIKWLVIGRVITTRLRYTLGAPIFTPLDSNWKSDIYRYFRV